MRPPVPIAARNRTPQRGATLLDALIAFALLAVGLMSLIRLHGLLEVQAEITRQRSESVRIAQQDLETLRTFAAPTPAGSASASGPSFADIVDTPQALPRTEGARAHTTYRLSRSVDADVGNVLKSVTTRVEWTARDGGAQQATLVTAMSSTSAALSGALSIVPRPPWGLGVAASPRLPLGSRQVDERRGVIKPLESATVAWVLDATTGRVVKQCNVAADRPTSRLTAADLTTCVEVGGLLLSGVVRFSDRLPPDAADANDPPLDLALSVGPAGAVIAASPGCFAEARKTVSFTRADGVHREAVPIRATPAQFGVANWTELGERFVAYRCLVPSAGDPLVWSGRSNLVPVGWTIGTTAADRRVCRYVDDRNGNGAIDRNEEHPAEYRRVDRALEQQNFLVIRGDQSCPASATTTLAGDGRVAAGTLAATETHQP
jgi:Tfp pilus assembly protein PilV